MIKQHWIGSGSACYRSTIIFCGWFRYLMVDGMKDLRARWVFTVGTCMTWNQVCDINDMIRVTWYDSMWRCTGQLTFIVIYIQVVWCWEYCDERWESCRLTLSVHAVAAKTNTKSISIKKNYKWCMVLTKVFSRHCNFFYIN